MSKIKFVHKNGREELMHLRYADVLQKLGRGNYLTRDLIAAPLVPSSAPHLSGQSEDLDALDAEALHALAKARQAIREAAEQ